MTQKKYSFIIPAYNSENTIKECLDSICLDVEKKIELCKKTEIIIVENGSTDSTKKIINKYLKKSKCDIKLLNSEKGVSKARNLGIENANGKYLIFIDSDDLWIEGSLDIIEKDCNEKNADLFLYSFVKGSKNTKIGECSKIIHNFDVNKNDEESIKAWMISKPTLRMQLWAKVFKSSIIKKNKLFLKSDLRYSEDSELVIRYLKFCNKINVSSNPIYKYTISESSVMRLDDPTRIDGYIKSMNYSKKIMADETIKLKIAFNKYVLMHLNIILVHDVFAMRKKISFIKDYKKMKTIIKNDIFSSALKDIKLKECLTPYLLPELFMKMHLSLFTAIICYLKSYQNKRKQK